MEQANGLARGRTAGTGSDPATTSTRARKPEPRLAHETPSGSVAERRSRLDPTAGHPPAGDGTRSSRTARVAPARSRSPCCGRPPHGSDRVPAHRVDALQRRRTRCERKRFRHRAAPRVPLLPATGAGATAPQALGRQDGLVPIRQSMTRAHPLLADAPRMRFRGAGRHAPPGPGRTGGSHTPAPSGAVGRRAASGAARILSASKWYPDK